MIFWIFHNIAAAWDCTIMKSRCIKPDPFCTCCFRFLKSNNWTEVEVVEGALNKSGIQLEMLPDRVPITLFEINSS